jgi:hypothetical protein
MYNSIGDAPVGVDPSGAGTSGACGLQPAEAPAPVGAADTSVAAMIDSGGDRADSADSADSGGGPSGGGSGRGHCAAM